MRDEEGLTAELALEDEIAAVRRAVDDRLDALFPAGPGSSLLDAATRAAVRGPGKRLRPLVTILGARDLGWSGPAIDIGCALELVHTASLILDDLPCMDNADFRRGKPAIHVAFGEDVAVLAAIALLTRAYGLLAAAPGLSSEQRVELVAILSKSIGPLGLVGGQVEDLRGKAACPKRVRDVNERKTGALFVAAAHMACAMARSPEECRRHFGDFGRQLGQAFQLLDDLLDLIGDPVAIGKPGGQDAGKPTLVRLLGTGTGRRNLHDHIAAASAALAALPSGGVRTRRVLDVTFAGWLQDLADDRVLGTGTEAFDFPQVP